MTRPAIVVQNTYVPRPGEGRALTDALKEANRLWQSAGHPALELWNHYHGPHMAVSTVQRWKSIVDFDDVRREVGKIPGLAPVVFEKLYPATATTYDMQIFQVVPE
jgi:hypothetical protein